MLWEERPNRPLINPYPLYLIGKTIEAQKVSEEATEMMTILQSDIKTHLLPLSEETSCLTNKNIKMYKASDNFVNKNLPKPISAYSHSTFIIHDRIHSSDEEENEEEKINEEIFSKSISEWVLRKVVVMNDCSDHMRVVLKFGGECNLHIPTMEVGCDIRAGSGVNFTFVKKRIEE